MGEVREINPEVPPSGTGCAECLAADPPGGGSISGGVRSAVTSDAATPRRVSTRGPTFRKTDHRYVQSFEPGEDWF
jgi:hypothetical protein